FRNLCHLGNERFDDLVDGFVDGRHRVRSSAAQWSLRPGWVRPGLKRGFPLPDQALGKLRKKGRPPSGGRPTLTSSFQSDREDRNDLVATVDDDDLVADHEIPESSPRGMDVHEDGGAFDHAHALRPRGPPADREVDIAGTRYIAAGQDRLPDFGALLCRQAHAAARLALLSLPLLGLPLLGLP